MDATAVVAIVSVIVTGGVSPYIAARVAAGRFEAEKRRAREDELRDVMETAGVRLTEAVYALGTILEHLSTVDSSALEPLSEELVQLWKNDDRLSVRLGSRAPEVALYRKAIDAMAEARGILGKGLNEGFSQAAFQALEDAHKAVLETQGQFYDAASRRIGPGELEGARTQRHLRLPRRKKDPPQLAS